MYHFERGGSELRSTSGYNLVSADLRDAEEIKEILTEARVDWQLPTLFVTEVALSYLNGEKCEKALRLCSTFNGDSSSSNNGSEDEEYSSSKQGDRVVRSDAIKRRVWSSHVQKCERATRDAVFSLGGRKWQPRRIALRWKRCS